MFKDLLGGMRSSLWDNSSSTSLWSYLKTSSQESIENSSKKPSPITQLSECCEGVTTATRDKKDQETTGEARIEWSRSHFL